MIRSLLATWAVGVTCAVALPGCVFEERSCTAMAADHGLHLRLQGAAAGAYTVTIRSNEVEAECPFVVGPQGDTGHRPCNVRHGEAYVGQSPWDGESEITVSGAYGSGSMARLPSRIEVSVFAADGTKLVEETRDPSYREDYPNGVECDGEPFRSTTEVFAVPPHDGPPDPLCTEMGLEHWLRMTFSGGTGTYTVVLDSTPVRAECELDTVQPPVELACVAQRGSATVEKDPGTQLPAIQIYGGPELLPEQIHVRVYDSAEQLVLEETRIPSYTERYPNGPECDRVPSRYATERFTIPAPEARD